MEDRGTSPPEFGMGVVDPDCLQTSKKIPHRIRQNTLLLAKNSFFFLGRALHSSPTTKASGSASASPENSGWTYTYAGGTVSILVVTSAQRYVWLKPRLHDTTCCQTGLITAWTTGCIVYTNIQPVVKPVVQPAVQLYSRLENRLHRVNKHPTDCQIFCTTGLTTG